MLLVTGASGLLGANLLSRAVERGREVVGLYHNHALRFGGAAMFKLDLTDAAATRAMVTELKPTSIVHCAAATNVDWCEDHSSDADRINAHASSCLAQIAQQIGAAFLYISTDAVFDGKASNHSELDAPAPINAYGRSKLLGESEVLRSHPSPLIVRVNIYGWSVYEKPSLAEWILHELESGKRVPGFVDIHFTPMLVNDLVDVLLSMLDGGWNGLFHVAGSERTSKYEFAKKVADLFGYDPSQVVPAKSVAASLRAARPADISLKTEKIASTLGYTMPDVNSGLRRFRTLRDVGYSSMLKTYVTGAAQ